MTTRRILYYLKIWWLMSKNSFLMFLVQKEAFAIFLFGKILRFGFFISFLYFLLSGSKTLAGYNTEQTIFFFLTFNLVDTISQFLYREVYRFRPLIVSGNFDLVLTKPVNALFRSLAGGADVIDLLMIPPLIAAICFLGIKISPNFLLIVSFVALVLNGLLIATAFHIAVLSLGIITLEVDHTVMIYRDLLNLGRFPIDIYREPLRGILTYLVPIAIMITLPAKALIGLASLKGILVAFLIGSISFFVSVRLWNFALKKYTSASS